MKSKILNSLLILTSFIGFLEWGKDRSIFLFQAEAQIISKLFTGATSAIHPLTILPLAGQIMLLITLFQRRTNKIMTFSSIAAIGLLLGFMFVIGLLSLKLKILLSTIPFIVVAVFTIHYHVKLSKLKKPGQ